MTVEVGGKEPVPSLPAEVIEALLTGLDVPESTLPAAEAWHNTMQVMALDAFRDDGVSVLPVTVGDEPVTELPPRDLPSVLGEVRLRRETTGLLEWHAQALSPDTPDCPAAFTDCRTMQIEGETFLAKTVASGEREGWLYLERDHGDVRAQVVLEPYEDGWSVPVEAAAKLLLDGRWSTFAPESSVPYPEG